ncbi:hypothetical protein BJ138DRAFT_1119374 [Hygrophoropsis aurantiaca]|uniref:Uncharacterized protein n=1 Tax=Hygrophoropsis aurantiaca TaxID=72124 RepID=A0ACB7ZTF2_9AGAM|nr:hypothetical protein BJ138DRAFT_1119374 [Hygrophoropsis aurantiaca]
MNSNTYPSVVGDDDGPVRPIRRLDYLDLAGNVDDLHDHFSITYQCNFEFLKRSLSRKSLSRKSSKVPGKMEIQTLPSVNTCLATSHPPTTLAQANILSQVSSIIDTLLIPDLRKTWFKDCWGMIELPKRSAPLASSSILSELSPSGHRTFHGPEEFDSAHRKTLAPEPSPATEQSPEQAETCPAVTDNAQARASPGAFPRTSEISDGVQLDQINVTGQFSITPLGQKECDGPGDNASGPLYDAICAALEHYKLPRKVLVEIVSCIWHKPGFHTENWTYVLRSNNVNEQFIPDILFILGLFQ